MFTLTSGHLAGDLQVSSHLEGPHVVAGHHLPPPTQDHGHLRGNWRKAVRITFFYETLAK